MPPPEDKNESCLVLNAPLVYCGLYYSLSTSREDPGGYVPLNRGQIRCADLGPSPTDRVTMDQDVTDMVSPLENLVECTKLERVNTRRGRDRKAVNPYSPTEDGKSDKRRRKDMQPQYPNATSQRTITRLLRHMPPYTEIDTVLFEVECKGPHADICTTQCVKIGHLLTKTSKVNRSEENAYRIDDLLVEYICEIMSSEGMKRRCELQHMTQNDIDKLISLLWADPNLCTLADYCETRSDPEEVHEVYMSTKRAKKLGFESF